ncbi:hypothetical protein P0136_04655 [Lentisphaerota bacterium ZTH]|nr:hypothetical protein JYG24_04225 [Lentisphaerota bacterium]WET07283.1 hypothetical protein P0136_04655 [Lentisphaerota bacterium ZTH]
MGILQVLLLIATFVYFLSTPFARDCRQGTIDSNDIFRILHFGHRSGNRRLNISFFLVKKVDYTPAYNQFFAGWLILHNKTDKTLYFFHELGVSTVLKAKGLSSHAPLLLLSKSIEKLDWSNPVLDAFEYSVPVPPRTEIKIPLELDLRYWPEKVIKNHGKGPLPMQIRSYGITDPKFRQNGKVIGEIILNIIAVPDKPWERRKCGYINPTCPEKLRKPLFKNL